MSTSSHHFKLWLNVVTFIAIALVVYVARHDIIAAFEKMRHLNLWILALMIPAQFFSFYSLARVYRAYFEAIGVRHLPTSRLIPAVIELNFVNHILPSGGVSGFSYLNLRLKEHGISVAKSTLAQLIRFVLAFMTFIVLLLIGVLLLALEGRANSLIIFIATVLTVSIIFGMIVLGYIIGSQTRVKRFAFLFTQTINKLVHLARPSRPELIQLARVEQTLHELHNDYMLLRSDFGQMRPAVMWAFIANMSEVGQIYIAFVAHGAWINPGALIVAYAVATIAGLIAILPGGLGVYEPLMVAVLLSAGVPNDLAVSATLVGRVVMLTFTLGVGYGLYQRTLRRYGRADHLDR